MKRIMKAFLCTVISCVVVTYTLFAPSLVVYAETTPKTYTVTFRAGNVGRFQTNLNQIVGNDVEITANYIKFVVEKGESLSSTFSYFGDDASLNAFFQNITADIDAGYRLKNASSWCQGAACATVNRNTEYVLDYAKLVNPVKYVIRFVDAQSGEQIATPTIAYGDNGEEIICTPLMIESYQTTDVEQSIVLNGTDEDANIVTFQYTYTGETGTIVQTATTYIPGETYVETITNEIVEEVPGAVNVAAPNANVAEEENGNQIIEDEEVPLANEGEPDDNSPNLVDIGDEEIPLAVEKENTSPFFWPAVAGGTAAATGIIAISAILLKRKRAMTIKGKHSDQK